tara:strand:+ start:330 stop:593 length:264 start_codon:yes stop_codon:yes gene_type:complete
LIYTNKSFWKSQGLLIVFVDYFLFLWVGAVLVDDLGAGNVFDPGSINKTGDVFDFCFVDNTLMDDGMFLNVDDATPRQEQNGDKSNQ